MLNLLLRNKRSPIALDVGSNSVKMLQIQKVGNTVSVCACRRWQFPDDANMDTAQRRELVVTAVRNLLRTAGFKGRRVISALSCDHLGIKNIRLPSMPDHEFQQAVAWEASERLGFQAGEDQLKFLKAGQVRTGEEMRDEIIILTATKHEVEDHMQMLDEMGLKSEHIDAEPIALFRGFQRHLRRQADEQAVSVVIDIGLSATRGADLPLRYCLRDSEYLSRPVVNLEGG